MHKVTAATTESGAEYIIDAAAGFWYHRGRNMGRLMDFQVATVEPPNYYPWQDTDEWVSAEAPVMGRRMYFANTDGWRLSMPVVGIEIKEEQDDTYV